MQACNLRISSLQNYVSTCETQVTKLQAAQDSTMSQLVQVTTQRDEICNEVATLQNELAVERSGTSALKENLDKALANHDKAEQDNLKLVESHQVNEESIRTLINNYAKLKTMQMGCFAEMDSVVSAVAPLPSKGICLFFLCRWRQYMRQVVHSITPMGKFRIVGRKGKAEDLFSFKLS